MKQQEVQLDQFNDSLRGSQFWRDWLRARGLNPDGALKLSDGQRKALRRDLEAIGVEFGGGMEIDQAGNMNQPEGFGKELKKWGPIVGGAALAAFGIPGVMPGMLGLGGAAAPGVAANVGRTAATTAASAGGGASMWNFALPALIGTGGQVAGNVLAARGAGKAADAQERAATEALNWEKEQVAAEQSRLQPFRERGNQAMDVIAGRLGLPSRPAPSTPASSSASGNPFDVMAARRPGATQTPSAGSWSFGQPQVAATAPMGGTVRVRHPRTGEVRPVPSWQVPQLLQRGGQVVQ